MPDGQHYEQVVLANQAAATLKSSDIQITSETLKRQAPPQMLVLSHLSVIVGKQGFQSHQVLKVYQQMYQNNVVSYPRTADRKITQDNFDELLPLAPQSARVVNIDPQLLVQTTCRPKFLIKKPTMGLTVLGPTFLKVCPRLNKNTVAAAG